MEELEELEWAGLLLSNVSGFSLNMIQFAMEAQWKLVSFWFGGGYRLIDQSEQGSTLDTESTRQTPIGLARITERTRWMWPCDTTRGRVHSIPFFFGSSPNLILDSPCICLSDCLSHYVSLYLNEIDRGISIKLYHTNRRTFDPS